MTLHVIPMLLLWGVASASWACGVREPTRATGPGPHDYTVAASVDRLWHEGDEGEPLFLRLRVLDTCGKPLPGAGVQVLHANHHGDHEHDRWRTRLTADDRGELKLITVSPGHTGGIPRHIHFVVSHPGHRTLVTRLFFKNDPTAGESLDDLALVPEEVRRDGRRGWVAGYEFVIPGQ
jgi:protocatechuate 3,4-dioxygenase beta subunit